MINASCFIRCFILCCLSFYLGKSLLLKEVCIREVQILEDQWNELLDSTSEDPEYEQDKARGILEINHKLSFFIGTNL